MACMFIYYNDGNSTQWVPAVPVGNKGGASTYDKTITAQGPDPGGYTLTAPLTITQGLQVAWASGGVRSFTANNPNNAIEVDVTLIHGAGAATISAVSALFIDGAANAVQQCICGLFAQQMAPSRLVWRGVLAPGAHTFQTRFAGTTGSYLLRNDASILTGAGVFGCTMTIREVL